MASFLSGVISGLFCVVLGIGCLLFAKQTPADGCSLWLRRLLDTKSWSDDDDNHIDISDMKSDTFLSTRREEHADEEDMRSSAQTKQRTFHEHDDVFKDVHSWSTKKLREALRTLEGELQRREREFRKIEISSRPDVTPAGGARFKYVHKHTYATGDPKAAAYFVASYFGGWCNHEPGHGKQRTHCNDTAFEEPMTWNAYFPPSLEQPLGFSIHFVKNPHKLPAKAPMNETELGLLVEKWRGNFSQTGRFDQFMDNHLGLVFDSLDPLVEKWQRDGVPFICRSWCCGPGFEQWPDRCPFGPSSDTDFCEQGCYVEVPHGIILEALCGMENYKASRKCLTKVGPHQLKSFDLCSDN